MPSALPPPPAPVPRVPIPPTPYASPRPAEPLTPPSELLMPLPSPPGPSTLLAAPPPATPIFESAAIRPSFLILARSLSFLLRSTSGVPFFEGAASFFFASSLPSLPSSPLLFSPSLAPERSLNFGWSIFSGGFTWYLVKRCSLRERSSENDSSLRGVMLTISSKSRRASRPTTSVLAKGMSICSSSDLSRCRAART